MSDTLKFAQDLIKRASITPDDAGCQAVMIAHLSALGFDITPLKFGVVENFWATHGTGSPVFAFAGHTDVVPVGDAAAWTIPPFSGTVQGGLLHGRGAADMKGSLAAMMTAVAQFVADYPNHPGTLAFLITADEEGVAVDGTVRVAEHLQKIGQAVDYCLVGEPSSSAVLGDVIKNGRRGSLNGKLTIIGKQGHIAYPHLARNPVHLALAALQDLTDECWDLGNDYFPATSFQISNIHAGTGVTNVIANTLAVVFNFRYSTESTEQNLRTRLEAMLDARGLDYRIEWQHSGAPFLTEPGKLVNACTDAILKIKGISAELSTSGGTSDGRFIAPILGAQVVELGPKNATIHQVDECVSVQDLDDLSQIYYQILRKILR